jgi:hypothetical protein
LPRTPIPASPTGINQGDTSIEVSQGTFLKRLDFPPVDG